jgi:alpha-beta hydrolase superfamily lysophospholipase
MLRRGSDRTTSEARAGHPALVGASGSVASPRLSRLAPPFYIETGGGDVFAVLDAPAEPRPGGAAALICAPWGWDEVASYRPRRALALRLAAAGHPTVRFDLPGAGNSAGSPRDEDLLGAWLAALADVAAWTRAETGAEVAALGFGLGGLLALEAAARGAAIDRLALWAAPLSGAAFVKEAEKFARLQAWQKDGEGAAGGLEEGWTEASGFLLGPETAAALRGLQPAAPPAGRLRRALLLGRNGVEADQGLQERLRAAGAEVEAGPGRGRGWGAMVSHPERARLPGAAAGEIEAWLAAGDGQGVAPAAAGQGEAAAGDSEGAAPSAAAPASAPPDPAPGAVPTREEELTLSVGGATVTETPIGFETPADAVLGIHVRPEAEADSGLCAVFFNAGGVRNTGPNRMWVERARAWAGRGVASVRIDLEMIGEAGGDPDGITPGNPFFDKRFAIQAEAVLAQLRERGIGERFLLVGLCSGGYFAFRTAQRAAAVEAAVLVNPWTLVWYPELEDEREARKAARVVQRRWIAKLLRGEVAWGKLTALARSMLASAGHRLRNAGRARRRRRRRRAELDAALDRLRDAGVRMTIAFSAEEPLREELADLDFAADLGRWPNLTIAELPGADHTLRPYGAQRALAELLDAELMDVRVRQVGDGSRR